MIQTNKMHHYRWVLNSKASPTDRRHSHRITRCYERNEQNVGREWIPAAKIECLSSQHTESSFSIKRQGMVQMQQKVDLQKAGKDEK